MSAVIGDVVIVFLAGIAGYFLAILQGRMAMLRYRRQIRNDPNLQRLRQHSDASDRHVFGSGRDMYHRPLEK